MNLSNVSNIRFNGVDVKMVKLNGDIVYRKEEEEPIDEESIDEEIE